MQVTGTARATVITAVLGLLAGGLFGYSGIAAISYGVLLWLGIESMWLKFQVAWQARHLTIDRVVSDRSEAVQTLWEGKSYNVKTNIRFGAGIGSIGFRHVTVDTDDVYPSAFSIVAGTSKPRPFLNTAVDSPSVSLRYSVEAKEIGVATFRGVRARFTSPSGLFTIPRFFHQADDYIVAPRVFQFGSPYPLLKQDNRLSPPGIHTHRRAGSGSELLEIREYVPGDPPKSIAWKMTARRDQLMSKQFECEVPLRCTLFIDTSASTYLRTDRPPVIQPFVRVASTLIEFLTASRDPVGAVTFDASSFQVQKPSASRRASLRMVRALTTAVTDVPRIDRAASNIGYLTRLGLSIADTQYPELHAESCRGFGLNILPALRFRRGRLLRRYRMAAILCAIYGCNAHTLGELLYNDSALVGYLQKFLLDHQSGLGPSRSSLNLENIADPRKVANLTRLLRHAVARSRDQERFVILADLLHVADHLAPLSNAIRTAQAHGHRVSVVCAWDENETISDSNSLATTELPPATKRNARELFSTTQATFLNRRFQQLQREMARVQVRVVGVHEASVMPQILAQLQMARPGRIAT